MATYKGLKMRLTLGIVWLVLTALVNAQSYTIDAVSGETLYIGETQEPLGSTGIVIHTFSNGHEAILGAVEVVRTGKKTALKQIAYKELTQDALSSIVRKPQKGDAVHMGWLYHRVLLIAPTLTSYNAITKDAFETTYVHPDLFASYLSYAGHPTPLKEDFQDFCTTYDIGLVQFYVASTLYTVDCRSFMTIKTQSIEMQQTQAKLPFYSRVDEIDANWWGKGSGTLSSFDPYYLKLLGTEDE